jgi:predicted lipid-binding transport protein (Tim44 family)
LNSQIVEILILAAVVALVLGRLYVVLGRRTGSERPEAPPQPNRDPRMPPASGPANPSAGNPAQAGVGPVPGNPYKPPRADFDGADSVYLADPAFDASAFLGGARAAYEMIVTAFSRGDKPSLQPLLTPAVFAVWSGAIDGRTADGPRPPELVRLRSAALHSGNVSNGIIRLVVRFEAELAEGATGLRDARELWTFEREIRARGPNWQLADVAQG